MTEVTKPFPRMPRYRDDDLGVLLAAIRGERLSDTARGNHVAALEEALIAHTGRAYALSTNSGTAALHAALFATIDNRELGVIVSPLTWISAIMAIFQAGSYPVFCDHEPNSTQFASTPFRELISKTPNVLNTHLWGIPSVLPSSRGDRRIVDDCSHAHGALVDGRSVGSDAAVAAYSFQDAKPVSGGEGGGLVTDEEELWARGASVGHHLDRAGDFVAGYKYRISVLSAILARSSLSTLEERNAASRENNRHLSLRLLAASVPLTPFATPEGSRPGWYRAPYYLEDGVSPSFISLLEMKRAPVRPVYEDWTSSPMLQNIERLREHYPQLAHAQYLPPAIEELGNAHKLRSRTLLFKIPEVVDDTYMDQVADAVIEAYRESRKDTSGGVRA